MSFCSGILFVLALVLLSAQCSYAAFSYQDDINNEVLFYGDSKGCIAEGMDCENRYTICCYGLCRCKMEMSNCHCKKDNNF